MESTQTTQGMYQSMKYMLSSQHHNETLYYQYIVSQDVIQHHVSMAKITAYDMLEGHSGILQDLASLGSQIPPTQSQFVAGMKFVCMMNGKSTGSLNQMRCDRASKAGKQLKKLPPTENSFGQHLLDVVYK